MVAKIVRPGDFSGSGGIWGKDGLEAVIRPLLQDRARGALKTANIAALTDNSTGVAANAGDIPDFPASGVYNATTAGGVQQAAFASSVTKLLAAEFTFSTALNTVLNDLGLLPISSLEGAAGTANTIAALDKAATAASGNAVVDFDSYVMAVRSLKNNVRVIQAALAAVCTALGLPTPALPLKGTHARSTNINVRALSSTPAPIVAPSALSSVAVADGSAFLLAIANDYAALAAVWNAMFTASTGTLYTTPAVSVVAG